jgi:hypothetical protein
MLKSKTSRPMFLVLVVALVFLTSSVVLAAPVAPDTPAAAAVDPPVNAQAEWPPIVVMGFEYVGLAAFLSVATDIGKALYLSFNKSVAPSKVDTQKFIRSAHVVIVGGLTLLKLAAPDIDLMALDDLFSQLASLGVAAIGLVAGVVALTAKFHDWLKGIPVFGTSFSQQAVARAAG